jgi:hypothetical protein
VKATSQIPARDVQAGEVISFDRSQTHMRWNVISADVNHITGRVHLHLDGDSGQHRETVRGDEPVTTWEAP